MTIEVKICGLNDPAAVDAAVAGGAGLVGFVFFPPSPRSIAPAFQAGLAARVPDGIVKVGLVVDADDVLLAELVKSARLDLLQLHGMESPGRVTEVRERFGLPVMKALGISGAKDLVLAGDYAAVADRLLFDARPPKGATRPGGNAQPFDWKLLRGHAWERPWILAGGLDVDNVAQATTVTGATIVDVSSGVEDRPGVKNPAKIRRFLEVAKAL